MGLFKTGFQPRQNVLKLIFKSSFDANLAYFWNESIISVCYFFLFLLVRVKLFPIHPQGGLASHAITPQCSVNIVHL